eukprot:5394326-Amphidinium_carterae.1
MSTCGGVDHQLALLVHPIGSFREMLSMLQNKHCLILVSAAVCTVYHSAAEACERKVQFTVRTAGQVESTSSVEISSLKGSAAAAAGGTPYATAANELSSTSRE